jgi:hypothetical protein
MGALDLLAQGVGGKFDVFMAIEARDFQIFGFAQGDGLPRSLAVEAGSSGVLL